MATLHIEHPITEPSTWLGAFSRFAYQPVDDDKCIVVELEFDSAERAAAFQQFLETNVWSSPEASPGLAGTPRARVLEAVDTAA